MTEETWVACACPTPMLGVLGTPLPIRKRRLFEVACCRRIASVLTVAGKRAVNAAEAFADGQISQLVLHNAWRDVGYPRNMQRRYASAAARAASVSPGTDLTAHAIACAAEASVTEQSRRDEQIAVEQAAQAALLRDIFGNPFRKIPFSASWRTDTAVSLAKQMYEARDFSAMPILADALQDAGCDREDVLNHCRCEGAHVRGCWVIDLVLGKE